MDELTEAIYRLHAQILKTMAQPKRLMILDFLHSGPKTVGEIVDGLELPQANVSQHLAAMRAQELVTTRRDGNTVCYSLVSEKVVEACDLFHQFLQERLQNNQALATRFPAARPLLAAEPSAVPVTGARAQRAAGTRPTLDGPGG